MSNRTLSGLRRTAPLEDRCSSVFSQRANQMQRPSHTRYITVKLRPESLDELRTVCGQYGDAAVREASWGAVSGFLMGMSPEVQLSNSVAVAVGAINLCRNADRARGYPNLSGKPQSNDLPNLSPELQADAVRVANETVEDWKQAGSPHLSRAIASTHETIAVYQRRHPSPEGTSI